jgi:hypothetical protein
MGYILGYLGSPRAIISKKQKKKLFYFAFRDEHNFGFSLQKMY